MNMWEKLNQKADAQRARVLLQRERKAKSEDNKNTRPKSKKQSDK